VRIIDEYAPFHDFGANLDPLLDHAPAAPGLTVIAAEDCPRSRSSDSA
jgi:hypothetical protein